MSIFLSEDYGGADANVAAGIAHQMHNVPTCKPLYYPINCSVPIPSDLLNSIISEIACAVDSVGISYDCNSVCNFAAAVMSRASVSGWCGASRVDAEAAKGSALAHGDHWLDATSGMAYYVDASGQDVAFSPQPAVFLCCSSGRIYVRCGSGLSHLPGTGDVIIPLAEGQCGDTAPQTPVDGTMWMDTSTSPRVVRVFDGDVWQQSDPQPEFFTCCTNPEDKKLFIRCGGSYFYLGEPAAPPETGIGWVTVLEVGYSTSDFYTDSNILRTVIDSTGLDFSQVLADATKVRVTVGAGGDPFHLDHLCMGEEADSTGYDHTAAGTVDVTFGGSTQVVIPAGDTVLSDEIDYIVNPNTYAGFWFGFKPSSDYTYNRPNRVDNETGARGGSKTDTDTCGNVSGISDNPGRIYLIRKIEVFVP